MLDTKKRILILEILKQNGRDLAISHTRLPTKTPTKQSRPLGSLIYGGCLTSPLAGVTACRFHV